MELEHNIAAFLGAESATIYSQAFSTISWHFANASLLTVALIFPSILESSYRVPQPTGTITMIW